MKFLVLGASGFIGKNLVRSLALEQDNTVVAFSRKGQVEFADRNNISVVNGDFLKLSSPWKLLEGVDVVYHLIATSKPSSTNLDIAAEMTDLVRPTDILLRACVDQGVSKVIFISSGGTVYGKDQTPPFNELMREQPINAYGIQKVQIEKMLYLYNYLYGLDYNIVRLANPFGPGQDPAGNLGVVTTFIYKAITGEEAIVYGNGDIVRDYIYIDDVIRSLRKLELYSGEYRLFNLGSGSPRSIIDIIQSIEHALSTRLSIKYVDGRKSDVLVNYLDVSRFTSCFGYPASTSFEKGISLTAEYLKNQTVKQGGLYE